METSRFNKHFDVWEIGYWFISQAGNRLWKTSYIVGSTFKPYPQISMKFRNINIGNIPY